MAVGARHVLDLDAFARFLASAVAGPYREGRLPQLQARDGELGAEGSWSLLTARVAALRPDLNEYIESLGLEHHRRVKAVVQSFLAADGSRSVCAGHDWTLQVNGASLGTAGQLRTGCPERRWHLISDFSK